MASTMLPQAQLHLKDDCICPKTIKEYNGIASKRYRTIALACRHWRAVALGRIVAPPRFHAAVGRPDHLTVWIDGHTRGAAIHRYPGARRIAAADGAAGGRRRRAAAAVGPVRRRLGGSRAPAAADDRGRSGARTAAAVGAGS